MRVLVLILGERARPLAERIAAATDSNVTLAAPGEVRREIQAAFRQGRPIIGVCASAILIRSLSPLLADKHEEPPVIAISENGRSIVPLLGGHRGANRIARDLAELVGGHAAITTASDLSLGLALDEPPRGWRMATNPDFRRFVSARLNGEPCRLIGDAPWLRAGGIEFVEEAHDEIIITYEALQPSAHRLVYHQPRLALGIGCERNAPAENIRTLVHSILDGHGLSSLAIAGVFSIDIKAAEPAIHDLAAELRVPARFFTNVELEAEKERLQTPSDLVFTETGCHGVAEGAALRAAGPEAQLLVAKRIGQRCTCAIALAAEPIDTMAAGRPRGQLAVLGIGPGSAGWRTAEIIREIRHAEDIVGYGLYLDLIRDLTDAQNLHPFPLGDEAERCRLALDLAADGRRVALVSSGDAGVYGMASLVMELLADNADGAWQRVDLRVCPGVSAMQAAAARAGAPLGHDFCAISLSDLMTPWPAIEARLRAAARADFVIALYNPVSTRRRDGFLRALEVLREARPPGTPVVIARNLGREGERISTLTMARLDIDNVDMLSLVIIGSRETRSIPRLHGPDWIFTPRGYASS